MLAWNRLLRAHRAALGLVEAALKAADLPSLEWYDVLIELDRGDVLRPRDLQERLVIAQYNLSRMLDRMVAAGLVARAPCPQDGRGQLIELTPEGRAMRAAMWPVYAAAIEAAVGERLSQSEAAALADLLGRLAPA